MIGSGLATESLSLRSSGGAIGGASGVNGVLIKDVGNYRTLGSAGNNVTLTDIGSSALTIRSIITGGAGNIVFNKAGGDLILQRNSGFTPACATPLSGKR